MTTTSLNTKIKEAGNTISDTSGLVTTTVLNAKIAEFKNKIPYHDGYITTQEFNQLTTEHFIERLKQAILMSKNDFDNTLISLPQIKSHKKIASK